MSKLEYTVNNKLELINYMKTISRLSDHKLISFDVKLLFTNVPLDFTFDLILQYIYEDNEIQANIKKKEMKELLFYVQKMYILVTILQYTSNVTE